MKRDSILVRSLTLSPQAVDPLSWFTRPFLPVTFAVTIAFTGVAFVLGTLADIASPAHQLFAVLLFVTACLSIHRGAGPRLVGFRLRDAILPLLLAWSGVVVSGIGAATATSEVSRWWAPLGAAVVLAALAPFNSAVVLTAFGVLSTIVCSLVAAWAFDSGGQWPVLTTIAMAALPALQATVATSLFSAFVVDRVLRWSALPIRGYLQANPALDFSQWDAQRDELKLLSDRVVPFIEQVADDGFVSSRDRTVAAELAGQVRDALLHTVDRSWLDSLAVGRQLQVVDPENRAGNLTLAQRGAVRSLLVAVLESAALVPGTLAVELRDSSDGGVAVGLTMKLNLPEGKRLMLLAPYYLTLQSTVDDLVWDDQDQLHVRFRIPAPEHNRD